MLGQRSGRSASLRGAHPSVLFLRRQRARRSARRLPGWIQYCQKLGASGSGASRIGSLRRTSGSSQSALALAHSIHCCFSGVSSSSWRARSSTAAMNASGSRAAAGSHHGTGRVADDVLRCVRALALRIGRVLPPTSAGGVPLLPPWRASARPTVAETMPLRRESTRLPSVSFHFRDGHDPTVSVSRPVGCQSNCGMFGYSPRAPKRKVS